MCLGVGGTFKTIKLTTTNLPSLVVRTDSLKGRRGRLPSKQKIMQVSGAAVRHSPPVVATVPAVPQSACALLVKAHRDTSGDKNLDFSVSASMFVVFGAH